MHSAWNYHAITLPAFHDQRRRTSGEWITALCVSFTLLNQVEHIDSFMFNGAEPRRVDHRAISVRYTFVTGGGGSLNPINVALTGSKTSPAMKAARPETGIPTTKPARIPTSPHRLLAVRITTP